MCLHLCLLSSGAKFELSKASSHRDRLAQIVALYAIVVAKKVLVVPNKVLLPSPDYWWILQMAIWTLSKSIASLTRATKRIHSSSKTTKVATLKDKDLTQSQLSQNQILQKKVILNNKAWCQMFKKSTTMIFHSTTHRLIWCQPQIKDLSYSKRDQPRKAQGLKIAVSTEAR